MAASFKRRIMKVKKFVTFEEAMEILGVKSAQAYNIMRDANVAKFRDRMKHVKYLGGEILAIAAERAKFTKVAK